MATSGYEVIYKLNSDGNSLTVAKVISNTVPNIKIPMYNNYLSVTAIGPYAFNDCVDLQSVQLPDSIIIIDEHAFDGCCDLFNLNLPKNLKIIGNNAFRGCTSFFHINIPDGTISIGDTAFFYCTSLKSIKILSSVEKIGFAPFMHCLNLTDIDLAAENQFFSVINGNLYDKNISKLIQYCIGKKDTCFIIPNTVTTLSYACFYHSCYLKEVIISKNVSLIEQIAFMHCRKLKEVSFVNSDNWYTSKHSPIFSNTNITDYIKIDTRNEKNNAKLLKEQYNQYYWINSELIF